MAFVGLGGGVNLGSATGYLFIDGSGMKRGLNTAGGAIDDLTRKSEAASQRMAAQAFREAKALADQSGAIAAVQARAAEKITKAQADRIERINKVAAAESEKVAKLQQRAIDAAAAANRTSPLGDPAAQQQVIDLAEKSRLANAAAARTIAQGYREREAALKALTATTTAETAKQTAAQNAYNRSLEAQKQLQRDLQFVQRELRKKGLTVTDRTDLTAQEAFIGKQLRSQSSIVESLKLEATRVQDEVAAAIGAAMDVTRKRIGDTLEAERQAIHSTRIALSEQNREYSRLATIAGPAAEKAAAAVDKAGRASVKAASDIQKLNAQIFRQQQIIASGADQQTILAAEQRASELLVQRTLAYDRLRAANRAYTQETQQFGDVMRRVHGENLAEEAAATAALTQARIEASRRVTDTVIEEDRKLTALRKAEDAKVVAAEKLESDRVVAIKEQEAAKVAAAQAAEQAAVSNVRTQALGSALSTATFAAVALGGAVGAAAFQFGQFDEAMQNVASISTDTEFVFGEMQERIKTLAVELGKSPTELANALYEIVSSGFEAERALVILESSAKGAVAGLTDVENAAKSITAVVNAYQRAGEKVRLTFEDVGHITDVAFAGVDQGVFSFKELTQQQGDNLSIAAELSVSYEELIAAYVVLTRRGNSLAESTTQLNGIMRTFLKPNVALAKAVAAYGREVLGVSDLTGAALIEQYGFGEALKFVNEAVGDNTAALGELFPNVRALRGEVGLGGQNLVEFNAQLARMKAASLGVGAAQRAFNQQSQAFNFQLRQAREEARVAAITFGAQVAPGILVAAKAAGAAAAAFTALPGPVQSAIGGVAGFGLSAALAVVVVGNLAKAVISGKDGILAMTKAIQSSTKAMAVMRLMTNPLVLGFTALALVGLKLYQRHRDQQRAAKELTSAYDALNKTTGELSSRPDVNEREEATLNRVRGMVEGVIETNNKLMDQYEEGLPASMDEFGNELFTITEAVDAQGNAIKTTLGTWGDVMDELDDLMGTEGQTRLVADLNAIIATPDLDVDFVAAEIQKLVDQFRAGDITADEFGDGIHALAADTDALTVSAREAAASLVEDGNQLRNLGEFFGEAGAQADELRSGLRGLIDQALKLAGAKLDFSSPLAFIQSSIGGIGQSAATTLLQLQALGRVSFSDTQQEALRVVSAIDQWQAKLDTLNAEISASQQRISEWQNIQQLVTDTVGTQADGFAKLQSLAERFGFSQEQVNEIQQAAIYLNDRATLSILDEQAALALSLPDLAAFTRQHQLANAALRDLSPEARGFAQSLQDANTQAVIMTVVMAQLAHAMNPTNFPEEFLTEFIIDVSQASPVIAAVLDELGLIPDEIRSELIIDAEFAELSLEEIRDLIDLETDAILRLTDANRELTDAEKAELAEHERRLNQLRGREAEIVVTVKDNDRIPDLRKDVEGLETEVTELEQAWIDAFAAADTSTETVQKSVAAAIPELLRLSGAVEDFSDPLAFLTKNVGLFGESFAEALLKGEQFGQLSFSQAEREALRVQATIDGVNRKIGELDTSIEQNEQEMGVWQGRIDLVDRTIGTAENGYAELNQLLQTGRITQEQYNQILAAGNYLRARGVEGVLDERTQIALSLPALANYIALHDNTATSYDNLTDGQKGFLAALQDESVQIALNTYLMLSFLELMGKLPFGTAQRFLDTATAANPVLEALVGNIFALPDNKNVDVTVTTPDPAQVQEDVDNAVPDTANPIDVGVVPKVQGDQTGGLPALPDQSFTVTADTSPAQEQVGELLAVMQGAITQASSYGQQTGYFYDVGVTSGVIAGLGDVFETNLIFYDNWQAVGDAARNIFGPRVGQSFDYGVADGIVKYASSPSNAAYYLGRLIFASAMRAIVARSPSHKGMEVGRSFVQGATIGMLDETANAERVAADSAGRIADAFGREIDASRSFAFDVSAGRAFGGDGGITALTNRSGTVEGGRSVTLSVGSVVVSVDGARDPDATAQAVGEAMDEGVWSQLLGSIRRLDMQVRA